jgi:hypothetical protein
VEFGLDRVGLVIFHQSCLERRFPFGNKRLIRNSTKTSVLNSTAAVMNSTVASKNYVSLFFLEK